MSWLPNWLRRPRGTGDDTGRSSAPAAAENRLDRLPASLGSGEAVAEVPNASEYDGSVPAAELRLLRQRLDQAAESSGGPVGTPAADPPSRMANGVLGTAASHPQLGSAENRTAVNKLIDLEPVIVDATDPQPSGSAPAAPPPPAKQASILVVDDQQTNRELLLGYLSSIPCTVREAADGESALAAVAEEPPDLILLDIMMPGLNGYAVTQRLKTDPRTATIPVVLVTSLQETADRLKGLQAGADEFLTKPVDRAELVTRVRTLLRLKRLRDERQAVGELGQRALIGIELAVLMDEAAALLARTLHVDYVGAWELLPPSNTLLLRSGLGWQDGLVGRATVSAETDSQMGYSLRSRVPVVVEDLRSDSRFQGPRLLHEHGVTSGISVAIDGRDRRLGVLSVHTRTARAFTKDDIYFVESIAQVVATAIIRKRAEAERAQALLREQAARQRLEESNRALARATQAKSDFLASMSHELRTPLNSIIGFSELLLDDPAEDAWAPRRRHFVSNIKESGRHLLNLVNDILDLSKIEAGRMQLFPTRFDVSSSLCAVVGAILPLAEKKRLTLDTTLAPEVTGIYADERKFRQVLYNLLSNAVKFTPEGGRVDATARLVEGMVEIVVADTGIGIAPAEQERIFEPFQQLGGSAVREEGTGLGLALTRRLVELQGGQLSLESTPGEGSRFTFTIPLGAAPKPGDGPGRGGLAEAERAAASADSGARLDVSLGGIDRLVGGQVQGG